MRPLSNGTSAGADAVSTPAGSAAVPEADGAEQVGDVAAEGHDGDQDDHGDARGEQGVLDGGGPLVLAAGRVSSWSLGTARRRASPPCD